MSRVPVLAAHELSAGYGGRRPRTVLSRVSVRVERGELVAVLGPNGAGKSTLLRTLVGMQPPLAGRVELLGRGLSALSPRQLARRLGVVLPERVVPGMLSAYDLVALGRYPHTGWSGALGPEDAEAVDRAMQSVGVSRFAGREVAALSDGERQKVMIARALAQEPKLLILDEPTAFLDLPGRIEVTHLLADLTRRDDAGRSVLLSTHDLDLALRVADRVWLLDLKGRLRGGAPASLIREGAFQAAFDNQELTRYLPDPEGLQHSQTTLPGTG
ncbi:MAG: ABC transporter ATP-binding protein [bacterium]|nr:ABC transporter ATP-binding protein [bacterium]